MVAQRHCGPQEADDVPDPAGEIGLADVVALLEQSTDRWEDVRRIVLWGNAGWGAAWASA
jgi:hypothetical protein